jgi:RNA polymerase sigma factor (sigma-70 family)
VEETKRAGDDRVPSHRTNLNLGPLLEAACAHEGGKSDAQLLQQFLAHRDEVAFATLVRRHGPMVLGVCRRILGNDADAEDAFQAAFLILVRKARSLLSRPVLGDWLHLVARHAALKARASAARRRAKEPALARPETPPPPERNDWLPLLDEEVGRLPDKYRLPVVLCDLECRTRSEAAEQLGCPEGTVAGRLARGRALLAQRLLRRVRALAGVSVGALAGPAAQAQLPPTLLAATARAALAQRLPRRGAPHVPSPQAEQLARGVLRAMLWKKIKLVGAAVGVLAAVALGGWSYGLPAGETAQPAPTGTVQAPPNAAGAQAAPLQKSADPAQGPAKENKKMPNKRGPNAMADVARKWLKDNRDRFALSLCRSDGPCLTFAINTKPFKDFPDRTVFALSDEEAEEVTLTLVDSGLWGRSDTIPGGPLPWPRYLAVVPAASGPGGSGIWGLGGLNDDVSSFCVIRALLDMLGGEREKVLRAWLARPGQKEGPQEPPKKGPPPPGKPGEAEALRVEIQGTLVCKDAGKCYVSVTQQANVAKEETRIWFWLSEGEWKYWRDILPKLNGQQVTVTGRVAQLPEGHNTSIPARALYFLRDFEITTATGDKLK